MRKIPLIIDTDPGVDDTIALIMSMAWEGFDLKAITAVGGNVDLKFTGQNAKNIVALCGRDVPVALGAEGPLYKELVTAGHIHGINGMGTLVLPQADIPYADEDAVDIIYREAMACGKELRLLTLGPMTNVAAAFLKYPDLPEHIHSVIAMGGSTIGGNVTEVAEFNIYADPDAAQIVVDSDVEVTFVGLDVTTATVVAAEDNEVIRAIGNPVSGVTSQLNDYTLGRFHRGESRGAMMHDPLAASAFMKPEVIKSEHVHLTIDCSDGPGRGQFHVAEGETNAYLAVEANQKMFLDLLIGMLRKYS